MESGAEKHSLQDFEGEVSFRDTDKNRFYQFYPQDSLTTVALCKLNLKLTTKGKDGAYVSDDWLFIKRSSKKGGHAEEQLVEESKKKIEEFTKEHKATLQSIQLVVMITYSPCKECRPLLVDYLGSLTCHTELVLRFAYLYKDGITGDEIPIVNLANWLIELEGLNGRGKPKLVVELEAISVATELSDYSHRDKAKWIEVKKKREGEDKKVIDIVQQVYKRKRAIEKENTERAAELARGTKKLQV